MRVSVTSGVDDVTLGRERSVPTSRLAQRVDEGGHAVERRQHLVTVTLRQPEHGAPHAHGGEIDELRFVGRCAEEPQLDARGVATDGLAADAASEG